MEPIRLENGIEIDLAVRGREFLGLGEVRAGGVALRSPRRPMFVDIRTPDAVALCDYRLADRRQEGGAVLLTFAMSRRDGDLMDWMLHEVRSRRRLGDWTAGIAPAERTRLELRLGPAQRTFGGRRYVGFSYRYRYASEDLPIYRLLDRGTWEPGGGAAGCEFWLRNTFAPPIARFTGPADSYCTEWYLPTIANPNIFQFLPLQTESQGFTFTAADAGILITWPTEVRHVRSMFEKPAGEQVIVHWHEHCDDLSAELVTSPVEVLFAAGATDRVERANAYEAARDAVSRHLHEQIGARTERVTSYGMIEEWTHPDLGRYTERGVPALLAAGMKTIGLANHFENNMNTWGLSNMCCTVDLKFAGSVGGAEAMRRLCGKAHEGGALVQMWGNTSLCSLTPWFRERNGREDRIRFLPEAHSATEALAPSEMPFVLNPSGAVEADHYAPRFAVMNLRDPVVRDFWRSRWRAAREEGGLDAIFLDSSFNLSSDKLHFQYLADPEAPGGATPDPAHLLGRSRPAAEPPSAVLSQYLAHLEIVVEMQQMGYRYCAEDCGVFGTHRHGPALAARLDNLFLWPESLARFDPEAVRQAGQEPDDVFFRGLAYRMMWIVDWVIDEDRLSFQPSGVRSEADVPSDWHLSVLRAFNEANDHMIRRRILPGEQGVVYEDEEGVGVLWAFEDIPMTFGAKLRIRDLTEAGGADEWQAGTLSARARHVYLLVGSDLGQRPRPAGE